MVDTLARQRAIIGTSADWLANDLILGDGELALERRADGIIKSKVGNGALRFSQAPYLAAASDALLHYKGNANPTQPPPAGAVANDAYSAMPEGTLAAGWGAIAGQLAFAGDLLALDTGGRWNLIGTATHGGAQAAIDAAEDAAQSAAEAAAAAAAAADSAAQADLSEAGAIAAASGLFFNSTAEALSKGVIGNGAITPGTGGTAGSFAGTVTGGGGSGAAFQFVVAGGAVTQIIWIAKGVNYTTAPVLGFTASAGLTGAAATAVIGPRTVDGQYFLVRTSAAPTFAQLWRNVAGVAVDQGMAIAAYDATLTGDTKALLYGPAVAQVIGLAGAPSSAVPTGDFTFAFVSPAKVDSNIVTARAWFGAVGSLLVKIFEQIAGVWTQQGTDVSLTAVVGANLWNVAGNTMSPIPVKAGQIVGFYSQGPLTQVGTTAPFDSLVLGHVTGNVSTLPDSLNNQLRMQVGFDLAPAYGIAGKRQTIGRVGALTAGDTSASDRTYGLLNPATADANITALRAYCGAGVTALQIKIFSLVGAVWTQQGADVALPAAAGLNSYSVAGANMPAIPIRAGQIIGFHTTGGGVNYFASGSPSDSVAYSDPGNQSTLAGGTSSTGAWQIGVDLTALPEGAAINQPAAIQTIGRNVANMPTAGDFSQGAFTQALATPALNPSNITAIRAWCATGSTGLAVKIFRLVAGVWTQTGADVILPAAPGLNQWSVAANTMSPIFIPEGAIPGFFVPGGGVHYASATTPKDSTLLNLTGGNSRTVDYFEAGAYREIGFDLTPVAGLALQREPIEDAIDATERLKSPATVIVGAPGAFGGGNNFPSYTAILGPVPQDGVIATMRYYSVAAGTSLPIQAFRKAGGLFYPVGPIVTVLSGAGNSAVAVNLAVMAGDYIGVYTAGLFCIYNNGAAGKNPYWAVSGNLTGSAYPFAPDLYNTVNLMQIGFDIAVQEFRGLKYQTIGQAAYNALGTYDPNTLYVIQGALARDGDRPGIEELPAGELPPIGETLPGEAPEPKAEESE